MRRTAHGRVWLSSDALPLGFGHRWCDEAQKESSMRINEWMAGEMIPVQANRWKEFCGERKHEENSGWPRATIQAAFWIQRREVVGEVRPFGRHRRRFGRRGCNYQRDRRFDIRRDRRLPHVQRAVPPLRTAAVAVARRSSGIPPCRLLERIAKRVRETGRRFRSSRCGDSRVRHAGTIARRVQCAGRFPAIGHRLRLG